MDQWGTLVTGLSGFAFLAATIAALAIRKWRSAGYLAVITYVLLWPIHLWFWQFELIGRAPLPRWYFWSAVQQVVLGGIAPLILFCFRRFRPVVTALFLVYVLSLVLQLFSYLGSADRTGFWDTKFWLELEKQGVRIAKQRVSRRCHPRRYEPVPGQVVQLAARAAQ